jgi:hypothetical protein
MTTRTELIAKLNKCREQLVDNGLNGPSQLMLLAADMLEADKLQAAARLALDALLECQEIIDGEWGSDRTNAQIEIDGETFPEITALREALK